jgi:uncharacterized protein
MDNAVLIVAASGRALAASARRGGYVPLVVDWFGDSDTLALAAAHARIESGLARGMTADALDDAIARVTARHEPCGFICGTGFEDRPHLLAHLARRWPLLGNDASTVAKMKEPSGFAALCRELGIPHPDTALCPPADPRGWVAKRRGGAGGSHVKVAAGCAPTDNIYYQREFPGTPISVLFLADGRRALVLGLSTQWSAPATHASFRFGGAARPALLDDAVAALLADSVQRIAAATNLKGLNSADFLVSDHEFCLLEINPRPGATIDIFEPPHTSLLALHIEACRGALAPCSLDLAGAAATAIAYGRRDLRVPTLEWPEWTADRPHTGAEIGAGEPLCTVHASGNTYPEVRALVDTRLETILDRTHAECPSA